MKNVLILKAENINMMEVELNKAFDNGYHIQGSLVFQDGLFLAVVVKPF